jgi:hypothetical protein
LRANEQGEIVCQLPAGDYTVTAVGPQGVVIDFPVTQDLVVKVGEEASLSFTAVRVGGQDAWNPGEDFLSPPLSIRSLLSRGAGWTPKKLLCPAPAIGHARTYHLELEAPEGLKITEGRLEAGSAYPTATPPSGERPRYAFARDVQRAHLYVERASQAESGMALVKFRPWPSTVLVPAVVAAGATAVLLIAVAVRWPTTGNAIGPLLALLLLFPGGLAAFAVRSREHWITSSVLVGIRALTVGAALSAFFAAGLLLLARHWSTSAKASGGGLLVYVGLWLAAGIALSLLRALRRSVRPPEQSGVQGTRPMAQADSLSGR